MKYFSKCLMSHKIFSDVLFSYVKEDGAQNIDSSHQGDLRKTLNKSHPLNRYKANSGKN